MNNRWTVSLRASCTLGIVLVALCTARAGAQALGDDQCSAPVSHWEFVSQSFEQKQRGAGQDSLLRTLSCIARRDIRDRRVAGAAVRAIFSVAADDGALRRTLLEIITDPQTALASHNIACNLLVYVADDETRNAMLRHLAETWPATEHSVGYFAFFTELGDLEFLRWLEEVVIASKVEYVPRALAEDYAKRIRIQQNPEEIIGYLQSAQVQDACHWRYVWTLHHALRHAVPRERLRSAVLSLIRQHAGQENFLICDAVLVEECEKRGILGDEDRAALTQLTEALRALNTSRKATDPPWPEWAEERIAAKRAEFYHLPPPQPRQQEQTRDQQGVP